VRDHHPRNFLEKDVYEYMRKKGCKKLGLRYREEPDFPIGEIRKPSKPEDKLMDYVKEKILKSITEVHEKCEAECDKRWTFEDKVCPHTLYIISYKSLRENICVQLNDRVR
jgi:hypothetical protein